MIQNQTQPHKPWQVAAPEVGLEGVWTPRIRRSRVHLHSTTLPRISLYAKKKRGPRTPLSKEGSRTPLLPIQAWPRPAPTPPQAPRRGFFGKSGWWQVDVSVASSFPNRHPCSPPEKYRIFSWQRFDQGGSGRSTGDFFLHPNQKGAFCSSSRFSGKKAHRFPRGRCVISFACLVFFVAVPNPTISLGRGTP